MCRSACQQALRCLKPARGGSVALFLLLAGCAVSGPSQRQGKAQPAAGTSAPAHGDLAVWRLRELADTDQPRVMLRGPQGVYGVVDSALLRRILDTGETLLRAAGEGPQPEWVVIGSGAVNAFAFYNAQQPSIAISLGMIRLLGEDQDAWAALFGHELAHLRLDHHRSLKDRRDTAEVTSSVAGVVLSLIGLPFSSLVADAAVGLAERAYSRDDEREADRIGLQYLRRSGFATQGAISLQQLLLSARGTSSLPFLSTHPSGEERIENLRELIRSSN